MSLTLNTVALAGPRFCSGMFGSEEVYPPRPVEQAFPFFFNSTPRNDGDVQVCTTYQVVYLNRGGLISRIAGTWGVRGFKDGLGDQAQFRMGGYYGLFVGVGKDSAGNIYVTDTGNKVIRKLTFRPDAGPWTVSTWKTGVSSQALAVVNDVIWYYDATRGKLIKSTLAGAETLFDTPFALEGLASDGVDSLYSTTADGMYNVIWKIPLATGIIERFAGLTQVEVTALGFDPHDGPFNRCTFHTTGPFYFSKDIIFAGCGGDSVDIRKLEAGRVSTLQIDGTYKEVATRNQSFQGPLTGAFGRDENGYPYLINDGRWGFSQAVQLKLMEAPVASGDGYIDGYSNDGKSVKISGWAYTTGQPPPTVQLIVDNNVAASMTANLLRSDIPYNNHLAGYSFAVPDLYGDGKPHQFQVFRDGQSLNRTTTVPSTFTFTSTGGTPVATRNFDITLSAPVAYTGTGAGTATKYRVTCGAVVMTGPLTQLKYSFVNFPVGATTMELAATKDDGTVVVVRDVQSVTIVDKVTTPPPSQDLAPSFTLTYTD